MKKTHTLKLCILILTLFIQTVLNASVVQSKNFYLDNHINCSGNLGVQLVAYFSAVGKYKYVVDYGDKSTNTVINFNSNYRYDSLSHHYNLLGTYKVTWSILDSANNLLDSVSDFYTNTQCVIISGVVYNDINKDCIKQVNESVYKKTYVELKNSSGFYKVLYIDNAGNYSGIIYGNNTYQIGVSGEFLSCSSSHQSVVVGTSNIVHHIGILDTEYAYIDSIPNRSSCDSVYFYYNLKLGKGTYTQKFDFGDGTFEIDNFSASYFGFFKKHHYPSIGNYTVKIEVYNQANVLIYTYTKIIQVNLCELLDGTVFLDSNNDCIVQANELKISNWVSIFDSAENYITSVYSDVNGYFSVKLQVNKKYKLMVQYNKLNCNGSYFKTVTLGSIPLTENIPFKDSLIIYYKFLRRDSINKNTYCFVDSLGMYLNMNTNISNYSVKILWGDGTVKTINSNQNNTYNYIKFTHKYNSLGIFNLKVLILNNQNKAVDSIIDTITVVECGNIRGRLFLDINKNCTLDVNEKKLRYYSFYVTNSLNSKKYYYVTNDSGYFDVNVDKTANNTFHFGERILCNGNSNDVVFPSWTTNAVINKNIPFDPDSLDFSVHAFVPQGIFINQNFSLYFAYHGLNDVPNTTFRITLPPKVKLYGSLTSNMSKVGNDIVFQATSLSGYYNSIQLIGDSTLKLGDVLCFMVKLDKIGNETNLSNNTITQCRPALVSYDPNAKHVSAASLLPSGDVTYSSDELIYTIQFQNTGTAPAKNVFLLDQLDNQLDPTTFKVLGTSHGMKTYISDGLEVKFDYPNIHLIDSFHDEKNSHGYVTYSIKAKKGWAPNSSIDNTARIYFDYNDPVITNTTKTKYIMNALKTRAFVMNQSMILYPNPVSDVLNVELRDEKTYQNLEIVNIEGQVLFSTPISNNTFQINTSEYLKGLYFVRLKGEGGNEVRKFVKD